MTESNSPRFSDDRQYWWNGTEWRPISEYSGPVPPAGPPPGPSTPPAPAAPTKQGHGVRNALIGCGLVLVLGIVGFGVCVAGAGSAINQAQKQDAANATNCAPKPCANDGGFVVYVQKVDWNVPPRSDYIKPETGYQYAQVTVSFECKSCSSERGANPFNFVLKDSAGVKHTVDFFAPGETWAAVNLSQGAKFGPKVIDFQVPAGSKTGTLVWTPGFTDRSIPLT